jgi:hypothetical protein
MQAFQIVGFTPVLTENLTNGDCFFSAIYRSLDSRGLLPSVAGCLGLKHTSEAEFIQESRNLVATHVIAGEAMNMYEAFMVNFGADINSLILQSRSAPSYLQGFILKKTAEKKASKTPNNIGFYTYNEFAREIAKNIRIPTTWVGEMEVTIFRNLLKLCGVIVDIYSSTMPTTPLPKRIGDNFYIYLYNVGEVHWKHFILKDPGVQITLSRNTTPGILNSRWRGGKRKRSARSTTRRRKAAARRTRKA